MNFETHFIQPDLGTVIEIYHRHCGFDFLVGFCRGIFFAENHVAFLCPFRRHSNPGMTVYWAEPYEIGVHPVRRFVYGFVPEAEWMTQSRTTRGSA